MLIKELKEILEKFEEDKDVSIFLDLTSNFGIAYEIEDWADNNGHLDLWIRETKEKMTEYLKKAE